MKDTSQALPYSSQAYFRTPPLLPEEKRQLRSDGAEWHLRNVLRKLFLLPSPVWVELKEQSGDS